MITRDRFKAATFSGRRIFIFFVPFADSFLCDFAGDTIPVW
jgi:hypothetical protein